MTKQIEDILIDVSQMSEEELLARTLSIRKNRYETKPAKKKIEKKSSKAKLSKLLQGMSKEDQLKLFKEVKGDG